MSPDNKTIICAIKRTLHDKDISFYYDTCRKNKVLAHTICSMGRKNNPATHKSFSFL